MKPFSAVTLVLLASAGCSRPDVNAPSLLPRAVENRSDAEPVAAPLPAAIPDAALDQQIAALVATRDAAAAQFEQDDRKLAPQVAAARRAAIGSEAWLGAQTGVAALETSRATVSSVLTDLEELAIARANDGQPPYPAIAAAQAETQQALDRINQVLAQRKASLPG